MQPRIGGHYALALGIYRACKSLVASANRALPEVGIQQAAIVLNCCGL